DDTWATRAAYEQTPTLLMTPTNTEQRLQQIGAQAKGFVYAVARKGVTGRQTDLGEELYRFIVRCREATDLPLGIGFGLRSGEDLRQLQGQAEIGIVGSVLLEVWEREGEAGYAALLRDLAAGRA
ncbi:MAG: tryptophan synthase subunit alpha, partial [Gemmatimonadota bacterium]|nr:tryptophan synthase subunit alpha [Gemmatimonadota bacterium]